ncbi:MAG TPA: DR2241 family protein, partial [Chthoniobacterales bacterium]|nr:DR2241 family protein [Chthoniobacterales bacterium]
MPIEDALAAVLSDTRTFGQLLIQPRSAGGFFVCHREDQNKPALKVFLKPEDAIEIARYDDAGKYRPLKTAPNLRHGWRLDVVDRGELRRALDHFYPGRLGVLASWKANDLTATTLRETLARQSGMYRVASNISDEQAD